MVDPMVGFIFVWGTVGGAFAWAMGKMKIRNSTGLAFAFSLVPATITAMLLASMQ